MKRPTPGPWGVEPEQRTRGRTLVVISRGEILARSPPAPRYGCAEQDGDLANLTLMAAAPDLVVALQTIALHAPSLDSVGIRDLCAEALAKAGL